MYSNHSKSLADERIREDVVSERERIYVRVDGAVDSDWSDTVSRIVRVMTAGPSQIMKSPVPEYRFWEARPSL